MPVLFLANKAEGGGAAALSALAAGLDLGAASGGRRCWALLPASAATGEGLDEAAEWLLRNASAGPPPMAADAGGGGGCRGGGPGPERCAIGAMELLSKERAAQRAR